MSDRSSRREFLVASAAAGASTVAVAPSSVLAQQKQASWIDAHVHVWTPDVKTYPLDSKFKVADMQPSSFTPEELMEHCKPVGVNRVVLIQMSFYNFDNRYMLQVMKDHPGVFSGVGIVDHTSIDAAKKMKELASQGVRGFRLHARGNAAQGWVGDAGMNTVWETARQDNLAVCPLINPADLPHVDQLCHKHPETRVVVDHFARVGISGTVEPKDLNALCALAKHKHVHVKTSAFYALGKKQPPYTDLTSMIRRVVDEFGPDRLMWASDCPYQVQGDHTYEASIALIRDQIDFLSADDKDAILRKTAERVFFA